MVAYSFQKRFIPQIVAGLEPGPWLPGMKRHTLRDPRTGRSQHARPEQPLHLYTAMRTKHCRQIGRAVCRLTMPVLLLWDGQRLSLMRNTGAAPRSYVAQLAPIVQQLLDQPGAMLCGDDMDSFARTDGFADAAEMARFFEPPQRTDLEPGDMMGIPLVLIGWAPGDPA